MSIINEKALNLGSYGVSTKGISVAGSTKCYNTIADRDADNSYGMFAFVRDASADSTVKSGFAIYYRKNNSWKKVFEEETMDQDIANLVTIQWENVTGKPTSTAAQIDDAVSKAHEHSNADLLNKISLDESFLRYESLDSDNIVEGAPALKYGNNNIKALPIKYTKWLQLIRPITSNKNLHCKIYFYTNPELTDIQPRIISSVFHPEHFKYFDGTKFASLVTSIPNVTAGRFVIVNVEHIIKDSPLFIRWVWTEADMNGGDTERAVSSGLCVYPSITPTNTESVGLVWQEQDNN